MNEPFNNILDYPYKIMIRDPRDLNRVIEISEIYSNFVHNHGFVAVEHSPASTRHMYFINEDFDILDLGSVFSSKEDWIVISSTNHGFLVQLRMMIPNHFITE